MFGVGNDAIKMRAGGSVGTRPQQDNRTLWVFVHLPMLAKFWENIVHAVGIKPSQARI